jgi:hypothetical protein
MTSPISTIDWGEPRVLRLTPAPEGSGRSDVSVEHDRDIAEG